MTDFTLADHGSVVVLTAVTDDARHWVSEHLPDDVLTWGFGGYVVEPRYVQPILAGIAEDGLEVQ